MCGMAGAVDAGKAPLTQVQWSRFVDAVAQLCRRYAIPVTAKTVLFHAEVQANLGITRRAKWEVARLLFDPGTVGAKAIGDKLRREVAAVLGGTPLEQPEPVPAGGVGWVTASNQWHCRTRTFC